MATRFTAHRNGKPFASARTTFGDAYVDVRQTAIVPVYQVLGKDGKFDPIKDDPRTAVTTNYTRGFSVVVTR